MFVRGASLVPGHEDEIADELNVKEVLFDEGPVVRVQLKPNLPLLGPRLGAKLRDISGALAAGEYEELEDGRVRAAGEELEADEVIRGERLSVDGFVMADDDVVSVALSTELDDELRLEKRVRDLIREINVRRKEEGLEITDRIVVTLASADADLAEAHADWIKQETLAVELRVDGGALADREGLNELGQLFLLDPEVVFLNHGSFGACPRPVFDEYQRWQRELERQPVEFLARRCPELIEEAKTSLATFLGARPDDLVFVPNATAGMNIVARSLRARPGDEVLLTNHEYGAVDFLWEHVCGRTGARLVRRAVEPGPGLVGELWSGVTPRTRVISVSHITSATALLFPVEEICRRGRRDGILVAVDGAHAPGQVDLDLESLGADFYAGNCHKSYAGISQTRRWCSEEACGGVRAGAAGSRVGTRTTTARASRSSAVQAGRGRESGRTVRTRGLHLVGGGGGTGRVGRDDHSGRSCNVSSSEVQWGRYDGRR